MAGPHVQNRLSGNYSGNNNQAINGGGINGGNGNVEGAVSNGGSGGGVRALRQTSDQSDVVSGIGGGERVLIGCGQSSSRQQGSSNNNLPDSGTNKTKERPSSAGCTDTLIVPVSQSVDFDLDATKSIKSDDVEQGQRKVRHKKGPLFRRVVNYVRSVFRGSSTTNDSEYEEYEATPRYRPDSLSALSRTTRFTEDEIKRIYRGFKAECPTGVVKEDTFKIIYSQFFPQGANPTLYAHYVFNTLDQDHSGIVSFEDFVQGLSVLSRGTPEEKLRWTFSLYDINGDGYITKEEMTDIVTAIYELIGRVPDDCPEEEKVRIKVERIFKKMDVNRDGVVTLDEFLDCCRNDEAISRSMTVFDTSF